MRIPNPAKLLPSPYRAVDLTKRVIALIPGLPQRSGDSRRPGPAATSVPGAAAEAAPPAAPAAPPKAARPKPAPKPKPAKPKPSKKTGPKAKTETKAKKAARPKRSKAQPKTAPPGVAVSGFPEPPGKDPGDISGDDHPHRVLGNPIGDPDPTRWPDPYDEDGPTRDPHPAEDPDAQAQREKRERDKLDL